MRHTKYLTTKERLLKWTAFKKKKPTELGIIKRPLKASKDNHRVMYLQSLKKVYVQNTKW